MNSAIIAKGLSQLDPANDAHWTNAGAVRLNILEGFAGEPITREQLQEHGPEGFERDTAANFTWEGLGNDGPESGTIEAEQALEQAMEGDQPCPFKMMEAFNAVVKTDRYRRNGELQAMTQQWAIQQHAARIKQDRIDTREKQRKAAASV